MIDQADLIEHFIETVEIKRDCWFFEHGNISKETEEVFTWLIGEAKKDLHIPRAKDGKSFYERREEKMVESPMHIVIDAYTNHWFHIHWCPEYKLFYEWLRCKNRKESYEDFPHDYFILESDDEKELWEKWGKFIVSNDEEFKLTQD